FSDAPKEGQDSEGFSLTISEPFPMSYFGKHIVLHPSSVPGPLWRRANHGQVWPGGPDGQVWLGEVLLTQSGKELVQIAGCCPDETYLTQALGFLRGSVGRVE